MPVTVTPQDVQDVLSPGNDYRPGKPLDPFIRVGVKITEQVQASAAGFGRTPMDAETANLCATWLAAWAYKCSDQQYMTSNAGRSSATFRGQSGKGFELNNYGAAAMQIDGTGILQAINESKIVGTAWLGKTLGEMIDYATRNI